VACRLRYPRAVREQKKWAILDFKRRNPRCRCHRIAEQISHAFGIDPNSDPEPKGKGSFITRIQTKW
jgi:hypothetical protein